jgi:hypothetical protein
MTLWIELIVIICHQFKANFTIKNSKNSHLSKFDKFIFKINPKNHKAQKNATIHKHYLQADVAKSSDYQNPILIINLKNIGT